MALEKQQDAFARAAILDMSALAVILEQLDQVIGTYYDAGYNSGGSAPLDDADTAVFGELTPTNIASGITALEQFQNMADNLAVTTGDYMSTLNLIKGAPNGDPIHEGRRAANTWIRNLKDLCSRLATVVEVAPNRDKEWLAQGFNGDPWTDLPAAYDFSKSEFNKVITLYQQLANFGDNLAVTQADYKATIYTVYRGNS